MSYEIGGCWGKEILQGLKIKVTVSCLFMFIDDLLKHSLLLVIDKVRMNNSILLCLTLCKGGVHKIFIPVGKISCTVGEQNYL